MNKLCDYCNREHEVRSVMFGDIPVMTCPYVTSGSFYVGFTASDKVDGDGQDQIQRDSRID